MNTLIRCDTHGCDELLCVPGEITQQTAEPIAKANGWAVTHGSARDYHHCPTHALAHKAQLPAESAISIIEAAHARLVTHPPRTRDRLIEVVIGVAERIRRIVR